MVSIGALNALPAGVREQLYLRLIPGDLIDRFGVDPATLRGPAGDRLVRIRAAEDKPWARIELRHREQDRDPVLVLDVGMSPFGAPELSLVQVIAPTAPRFGIDRDPDGHDTLLGTASRNVDEEVRALGAGLAPGQVRQGLRMLAHVLECMDDFCRLLGRDFYLVEPLFYHSALHYERHGCDYFIGRDRMDQIHAGFQPGGALCGRLDGSTPFRRPGFAQTVRGRSWAIHDGVLGEPFGQGPTEAKMAAVAKLVEGRRFPSFRISARRAFKTYPMTSVELNRELGAFVLERIGHDATRVDLHHADLDVHLEVLPAETFVYIQPTPGPGGLPVGASGTVAALLSGGIDSPVAAWRMMKRGCRVLFVHFHSVPYLPATSQAKARALVERLTEWQYRSQLMLVPLGEIQREVVLTVPPPLRVVVYRRMMVRRARALAPPNGARAP